VKHWINRACKSKGRRLELLEQVDLVDLCPVLLEQARRRTVAMRQVRVTEADAGRWLRDGQAEVIYFSYLLTMMPNWRAVIDNGLAMLRPRGLHVAGCEMPRRHAGSGRSGWRTTGCTWIRPIRPC
jgi:trans-aconitate methyltransferase